jgi:hypothetical protein
MSTDYALLKKVLACDLFDGRLEAFGVREKIVPDETTERRRCLTDGRNHLWVYNRDDGLISCLTRYAPGGAPGKILNAIAEACDTDIVSEHQPQFWGFETQEEWDAWNEQLSREHRDQFHNEILKYLLGEPCDIQPGTIGMIEAEIAKKLVEKDPELLLPTNKDKLLNEMETIYDREHAVVITLTAEEIASAKMAVTHEDDLPSA